MQKYIKDITTASVAQLRAKLSAHLRLVKAGGEVLITERGRPIARVVPASGGREPEEQIGSLVRDGQAREPRGPLPEDFLDRPRPCDVSAETLRAILEERTEGP